MEEDCRMIEVIKLVDTIEILFWDGVTDIVRELEPVRLYIDLQTQVHLFYPQFEFIFMIHGTSKIVGSQYELLRAYKGLTGESKVLRLDLKVQDQENEQVRLKILK
jgi:hypothetical protein